TNCTSFSGSIQFRSNVPRLPMPIPPSTIRSLGATAPPRPSADAGMMVGARQAAPAAAAVLRDSRRFSFFFVSGAAPDMVRSPLRAFAEPISTQPPPRTSASANGCHVGYGVAAQPHFPRTVMARAAGDKHLVREPRLLLGWVERRRGRTATALWPVARA